MPIQFSVHDTSLMSPSMVTTIQSTSTYIHTAVPFTPPPLLIPPPIVFAITTPTIPLVQRLLSGVWVRTGLKVVMLLNHCFRWSHVQPLLFKIFVLLTSSSCSLFDLYGEREDSNSFWIFSKISIMDNSN